MIMNRICLTVVSLGIVAGAHAHHSAAPHFDMDNPLSVEGVVTQLRLVNPHAYVYFDVTDDTGAVANWRCELSGATGMKRRGWTADSLVPGQAITVNGAPARREDHVCYTNFMVLEDGTRIDRNSPPAGDVLVADTVGFEQGILFPLNGRMHSADMQVTERFEVRDEGQTLVRSYVAHDPAFLQTDWVGESVFQRTSEPYEPYDCVELSGGNNRRPAPSSGGVE